MTRTERDKLYAELKSLSEQMQEMMRQMEAMSEFEPESIWILNADEYPVEYFNE